MIRKHLLFPVFISVFLSGSLFGNATAFLLSFDDLQDAEKHQGKTIQIRGFWYPVSEKEGYLRAQPNIKSCCTHLVEEHKQLLVENASCLFPSNRVIILEGTLSFENKTGDKVPCLKNASQR